MTDPQTSGPAVLVTLNQFGAVTVTAWPTLHDAVTAGETWQAENADDPNWLARLAAPPRPR